MICVVEEAYDVGAIERTGQYRGTYHVLGGKLSPLDGVGPDDLNVADLLQRILDSDGVVKEVILPPTLRSRVRPRRCTSRARFAGWDPGSPGSPGASPWGATWNT